MAIVWKLIPAWLKYLLAGIVAVCIVAGGGYLLGKRDGRSSVEAKIERQNNEATDKALGAVLDYDRCVDAGGVWTFRTGKCEWHP